MIGEKSCKNCWVILDEHGILIGVSYCKTHLAIKLKRKKDIAIKQAERESVK